MTAMALALNFFDDAIAQGRSETVHDTNNTGRRFNKAVQFDANGTDYHGGAFALTFGGRNER